MYETSDLCLATTLYTVGHSIYEMKVSKVKGKQVAVFNFEESPDLDIAINSYWDHNLKVDPKLFFTNLKELKGRIYETTK